MAAGAEVPVWKAAELIAAEGLSARGWLAAEPVASDMSVEREQRSPKTIQAREPWSALGSQPEAVPLKDHLADTIDTLFALAEGDLEQASPRELDARLRGLLALMQRTDGDIGPLLLEAFERKLFRFFGYRDFASYARNRLGLCGRKARALVAIERAARRGLPELARAYRTGRIAWYRAVLLLSLLTRENAAAWIERAEQVPARCLADEVQWARSLIGDGRPKDSILPPPLAPRSAISSSTAVSASEWQIRGHTDDFLELRFAAPVSVIGLLNAAITAFASEDEPRWRGLERLLDHFMDEWGSPRRHRNPIYARDGWRCAVPVCTSRRNLNEHHVVFRSRGGNDRLDNRITVCLWYHLRGIHGGGSVRVTGRAPEGLLWEVGRDGTSESLLRLRGERYCSAEAAPAPFARRLEPRIMAGIS